MAAIQAQAATLMHCPSAHPSEIRAEFYEALASIAPSGLERFLPAVTGAMANEMASRKSASCGASGSGMRRSWPMRPGPGAPSDWHASAASSSGAAGMRTM